MIKKKTLRSKKDNIFSPNIVFFYDLPLPVHWLDWTSQNCVLGQTGEHVGLDWKQVVQTNW